MATIVESIRDEFLRYKALAEAAIAQLGDADLSAAGPNDGNSIAIICWHLSGNLRSRFTDFLTTDGEKAWRKRDEEFEPRAVTREELIVKWQAGWDALLPALENLTDGQLASTVTVRQQPMLVHEALHRSLAHLAYHVGQIVFLSKAMRGSDWKYLSIPPGQSDAYNRNPTGERPSAHAATLSKKP
jgi:hypothetical protein